MKKILNFRPIVFLCILFALGIFLGLLCLNYGYLILIIFCCAGLSLIVFYLIIYLLKPEKGIFIKLFKLKFLVLYAFISVLLGFFVFNVYITGYNSLQIEEKVYSFSGTVAGTFKEQDEYVTLILENVVINDGEKTVKLKKKSLITFKVSEEEINEQAQFKAGQKIYGDADLKNFALRNGGGINTFGVKNGYRYLFYADSVMIDSGNAGFFAGIRQSSKDVLKENLNQEVYPVAYALIFGDTAMMKSDTAEAFRQTGLAHIFAVSGLHVGFLMAVLLVIFKKLKFKYSRQLIISALVLMFYAAVCGFSPSVLRAALMTLIYLLSKAAGKQYDSLSSLFLSALIILTFSPLFLFDAGFQMSFCAVFGIILLSPLFLKLFRFMPGFLKSGISASLSAQIGVLPLMAFYFNYVPVLSVFLNILVIPLVSIAFISILIFLLLSIIPFMGFLFAFPQILIEIVLFATKTSALVSFASVPLTFSGGFVIYYLLIVLVSSIIFIKVKYKLAGVFILSAVLITNLVMANLPNKFDGYQFIYYDVKQNICSFTDNGNFYIVAGGDSAIDYEKFVSVLKVKKLEISRALLFIKRQTITCLWL